MDGGVYKFILDVKLYVLCHYLNMFTWILLLFDRKFEKKEVNFVM